MTKKPCARCGEIIDAPHPNQKYCPQCSEWSRKKKARERKSLKAEDKRRSESMNKPSMSENMKNIARTNGEARKAGMSYGQWLAKLKSGGRK